MYSRFTESYFGIFNGSEGKVTKHLSSGWNAGTASLRNKTDQYSCINCNYRKRTASEAAVLMCVVYLLESNNKDDS